MEFLEVFPEDEIMAGIVDLGLCVTRFYSFLTIDLENRCVVQLVMYFFFFIR